jgi:hypothetical protein
MSRLYELGEQVAHSLIGAGFLSHAHEILHLCNEAINQELPNVTRENALLQIEARCHTRWLGDLYLPELSMQEWCGQLERLSKSVRKQKKMLKNVPSHNETEITPPCR